MTNVYNKLNSHEIGYTPYGIANCLLSNYTTSNGGNMFLCLKCYIEYNALKCGKYVVFQSPMYMKALLSKHPFYIQFFLKYCITHKKSKLEF
jgi:hypothetical protein